MSHKGSTHKKNTGGSVLKENNYKRSDCVCVCQRGCERNTRNSEKKKKQKRGKSEEQGKRMCVMIE